MLPTLPTITHEHRRTAFEAMHWPNVTFEAAMLDDTRKRVIECRAALVRRLEWERTQTTTRIPVTRVVLGTDGHPVRWITKFAPGPLQPIKPDLLTPSPSNPS
jgi:hypothetical protein